MTKTKFLLASVFLTALAGPAPAVTEKEAKDKQAEAVTERTAALAKKDATATAGDEVEQFVAALSVRFWENDNELYVALGETAYYALLSDLYAAYNFISAGSMMWTYCTDSGAWASAESNYDSGVIDIGNANWNGAYPAFDQFSIPLHLQAALYYQNDVMFYVNTANGYANNVEYVLNGVLGKP